MATKVNPQPRITFFTMKPQPHEFIIIYLLKQMLSAAFPAHEPHTQYMVKIQYGALVGMEKVGKLHYLNIWVITLFYRFD